MSSTSPYAVLWLALGFVLWSVAFVTLYALQALGCAYDWPEPVHRIVLVVGFGLFVVLHAALLLVARARRTAGTGEFLLYAGWLVSLAALVAAVFTYAPVFYASLCL